MRLKIRNFQSIARANLEISGFTVITGKSNIGKTALMRACQAAFFGLPGDFYIREGENHVGVAFQDTDIELIWRKTNAPNPRKPTALQVNGTVHTKIGRDHGLLTEPLGVFELQTTQQRVRPQFAMQHDKIFMLADSETTVAEILKLLGRIDVVTTAQQNAKRDLNQRNSKRKIREQDLKDAKKKLASFDYVPGMRIKLEDVKTFFGTMDKNNQERSELVGKLTSMQELEPRSLPELPDAPSPANLDLVEKIHRFQASAPINVPPTVEGQAWPEKTLVVVLMLDSLMQIEFGLEKCKVDREDVETDLVAVEELKALAESTLEACPVCDRPFEEAHDH